MRALDFLVVLFVTVLFLPLAARRVSGQTTTTGSVTGVVTDQTGAAVPNVKVALKSSETGAERATQTNSQGFYSFTLLAPGTYTLTFTANGFQTMTAPAVVRLGQVTSADMKLELGTTQQTIEVTSAAPLIQTQSGDLSASINQLQASNVPNAGNDLTYNVQLSPGVTMNTQAGYGNFSIYGMPGTSNSFTLDGMSDNDPFFNVNNSGATNLLLGQNEIQEVSIVNNGYMAQYGGLAGSNINYLTKSGTNRFHGNAIWYYTGDSLNANNYFNSGTPKSHVVANAWAASIGGPIKKDKLFFFFDSEGTRMVIGTSNLVVVPSAQFQSATIANLNSTGLSQSVPFYQQMFSLWNNAPGIDRAQPGNSQDPLGCNGFTGLGAGVPCAQYWRSNVGNLTHERLEAGRVDWVVGSNDKVFVRVQHDIGLQASYTDPISPIFNGVSTQPEWQGQLEETHTFGPTATNQFLISGQYYSAIFTVPNLAAAVNAFPASLILGDGTFGGPYGISLGGLDLIWPQGRNVTQYQIQDDATKVIGNHTLGFGFSFSRNDISNHDFGIGTIPTLIPFDVGSFFDGGPALLIQSFATSPSQPFALYRLGFYAQDQWQVRRDLTLTLALRAEHLSNPVCQTRCFAGPVVPFPQLSHDPNIPMNQAIATNLKQMLPGFDNILWQPRVGFAWQPFRDTVIRGGYGLFFDGAPGFAVDSFAENPPLFNTFQEVGNLAPSQVASGGNVFASAVADNQAFLNGFGTGATGLPTPNLFSSQGFTHAPRYQKWSLGIQRAFGANTAVDLTYVGNHGDHEPITINGLNAWYPDAASSASYQVPTGPFTGLPTAPADSRFGVVQELLSVAQSNYNGVTLSVTHRITRYGGGVIQANYTYGHALDMTSNGGGLPFTYSGDYTSLLSPQNPFAPVRSNYGNADYDVRHQLNLNYVWNLPMRKLFFGHGPTALVDGWRVSGAMFLRSGLPYTVYDGGFTSTLQGFNYNAGTTGAATLLATFNGGPVASCSTPAKPCLTTSQFTAPSLGGPLQFGNQERNQFRGPKFWDTDFSIGKEINVPRWEGAKLALAFQAFNVFNHPNFDLPIADVSSPLFGTIQSTVGSPTSALGSFLGGDNSPRIIQSKLSLTF